MGVLNATPDSFYDGGLHSSPEHAIARVDAMIAQGAEILDIGGESSRPGAASVSPSEQIRRIEAAVSHALARGAVVSIDTSDPEVADRMLTLGAHLINDVSCLATPELASVCAHHGASLLLMHSRGPMQRMEGFSLYPESGYSDVVREVLSEWRQARERAMAMGLARDRVWIDPGIGFGKSARHSFTLLSAIHRFTGEGVPVAVGPSRKSFIRSVDDVPAEERLGGTIAAALLAVEQGARILRVHDIHDLHQALVVARRIRELTKDEPAHV